MTDLRQSLTSNGRRLEPQRGQHPLWLGALLLLTTFALGGWVAMELVQRLLEYLMVQLVTVEAQAEILNDLDHLLPYRLGYFVATLLLGWITAGAYLSLRTRSRVVVILTIIIPLVLLVWLWLSRSTPTASIPFHTPTAVPTSATAVAATTLSSASSTTQPSVNATVSSQSQPTEVGVPQPTAVVNNDGCTPVGTLTVENGRIAYQGISFHLDPRLATTVTVEHCEAVPFSAAPLAGSVHPAGLTFTFLTHLRRVYFQPQVAVYVVEGDMQGYPYPANSLGALEALLTERPEPSPWFNDMTLHVQPKYLDFANGAGVRLIAQDAHDIFFYTNNNVFYNCDALTSDERFYVSVRAPVALPFLMDVDGPDPRTNHNPQAIPIPRDWPQYGNEQRPIIDAYNLEALRRFSQMTDAEFTPDLALLDTLVRSLEIVDR